MQKIWLNNKIVPNKDANISIWDRGFLYGDGVYETVRVYGYKIFRAEKHWKRLAQSLKGIHLSIPWSYSYLTRACVETVRANRLKECLVRVTISRGSGELGYDPSTCKKPTLVIFALPVRNDLSQLWEKGVKVAVAKIRRNHPRSLDPAIKSTNCLNGILAKMDSLKKNAFEGVFLNLDGYLAEGTISNISVIKEGVIKTPPLKCGILDGVTRSAMIEISKQEKIKVRETYIKYHELLAADEVFLTSTTMEVMPVTNVDGKRIGDGTPGAITRILQEKMKHLIQEELDL